MASILRLIAFALVLLPALAAVEPITLKLAFFSSDRSHLYLSGAKPFVGAVNEQGEGRAKIEVDLSSRLGGLEHLSQQIRDGSVDIGYVIPMGWRTTPSMPSSLARAVCFSSAPRAQWRTIISSTWALPRSCWS